MNKVICKVTYDTEKDNLVKKVTFGYYGDDFGYEETLYVTEKGNYFLYTNGGINSPYKVEKIKALSKINAQKYI